VLLSAPFLSSVLRWRIEKQDGRFIDEECKPGGDFGGIKLLSCRVRSIWLGNGFLSFLGSIFTVPLARQALTHWWVEIETTRNSGSKGEYFLLQWGGNGICLIPCQGGTDTVTGKYFTAKEWVTRWGKAAAAGVGPDDPKDITDKHIWKPSSDYTIGDVYKWCMKQDPEYDLLHNNCKHVAEAFYHRF